MIASLAGLTILILCITLARWFISVPVVRALRASVDQWADSVQGLDKDPI